MAASVGSCVLNERELVRIVLQRVNRASVTVDDEVVAAIGPGLVLLVGIEDGDSEDDLDAAAAKVADLRIFGDDDGRMNRSVKDVAGEALVVSQFTLAADVRKGRRPSFTTAADPRVAEPMVDAFAGKLAAAGIPTQQGVFGAMMDVGLVNDGPVTIVIDVVDGRVA